MLVARIEALASERAADALLYEHQTMSTDQNAGHYICMTGEGIRDLIRLASQSLPN